MEEKVYRRQVNKTSLSKRLIDRNNPTRHPDKWYCSMNTYDPERSTCAAKERDQRWYTRYFDSQCTEAIAEEAHNESQSEEKEVQTKRESIGVPFFGLFLAMNLLIF